MAAVRGQPLQTHRSVLAVAAALVWLAAGCSTTPSSGVAVPARVAVTTVRPNTFRAASVSAATTPGPLVASTTSTAVRSTPPRTACDLIADAVAVRHPGHATLVIVRTITWTDTDAQVALATKGTDGWRCGQDRATRVGRAGTRPLLERRSGDGTTPAGVFPLATMTAPDGQRFSFFGNAHDPGVTAGTYRAVQPGDCFGATPNTEGYGHLRNDAACAGADDEYLAHLPTTYSTVALIGANSEPEVSGDAPGEIAYAAAIFLHRFTYVSGSSGPTKATSGCVSLAQPDLTAVLVQMTPDTLFAIGPSDWLAATA